MSTKKVAGIVVAVVAALGLCDIAVAYVAGGKFQSRLEHLSAESVQKNEPIQLTNVQVDRGLFQSKATVDLDLVQYGIKIPIAMTTSQGFGLNGSVLRLHAGLGNLNSLPSVETVLNAIHDPNPMIISEAIGITGKLQKASIRINPLQVTVPISNDNAQLSWKGAKASFSFGHFGPSGDGTISGSYHQRPVSLQSDNLNAHLGKVHSTFRETGRLGNLKALLNTHSGMDSINLSGKYPVNAVIRNMHMRYNLALRENNESGNNPSGLSEPGFSLTNMRLLINVAKPVSGKLEATGSIEDRLPKSMEKTINMLQYLEKDLIKGVSANLNLHIQQSLLQTTLQKATLQNMVTAGYLKEDGNQYVTTVTMNHGVERLNGKKV